ncbi:MAG: hypoxanthine phosphoribosyltransferase [Bacteroidota bacterium]
MNTTIVKAHDLQFELYLSAEQIQQRVKALGLELTTRFQGKDPVFISILNGGFIFAADLTRACTIDCEISFIKLSSYQNTSSTGKVVTLIGLDAEVKGKEVIIVEDIVDTGETLTQFLKELNKYKPASITLVSLLVKPEALQERLEVDYVGFNIPNKFVIGYGLDYNGVGRNLPGIYQLVKTV